MAAAGDSLEAIRDWLAARRSLLVIAHIRPDGDAFGSVFAAVGLLRDRGGRVDGFFSGAIPPRYQDFRPARLLIDRVVDATKYDGLLCLDCANSERLDLPPGWDWRRCGLPICNIDHHIDNGRYGQVNYVDSTCAATTQILADLARLEGRAPDPHTATCMLLGLITDTGGFRFTNTDSRTLRDAAWLLDQQADYARIMDRVFFNEPPARIRLQARLLSSLQFSFDNRFACGVLTTEMFTECGVLNRDTEGLIDNIRVIQGVEISCLVQPIERDVHLSLRARTPATPVIDIAHALGGGGHRLAAGATMKNTTLEAALAALHRHVGNVLGAS